MAKSTQTIDEQAEAGARSFPLLLSNLGEGEAAAEMSREFWALTKAIQLDARSRGEDGESKGKIQITITVDANAKGEADLGWDIKITAPKKRRTKRAAWLLRNGNVTFEVPRQLDLGLREVKAPPTQNLDADGEGQQLPAT